MRFLIIIFCFCPLHLFGQTYSLKEDFVLKKGWNHLEFEKPVSALNISRENWIEPIFLNYLNQNHLIRPDEHSDDGTLSFPIIFDHPVKELNFFSNTTENVRCLGVFIPPLYPSDLSFKKGSELCEPVRAIPASVWRAGLPYPVPGRTFSKVRHGIVHHSAGLIFQTNYTEVVRSIYMLHTQNNGWDDIGYNYLIAWDGSFFNGRDPENGEQSDVVGAHFCSKNSNTMGICMIGTYTDTLPSDTAMEVLTRLLTWKYLREHISPNDSFIHPEGGSGSAYYLKALSGHRDGCSTECPGQELYLELPALSAKITERIELCQQLASSKDAIHTYTFNAFIEGNLLHIESAENGLLSISDLNGRLLFRDNVRGLIFLEIYEKGPLMITFQTMNGLEKKFLLNHSF